MIHAHAILTGYTALRGNPIIHLAMFFAMLILVPVPDEMDESFPGGNYWYPFAAFMHFILALITFSSLLNGIDAIETVKGSCTMIAVLAEILNFTIIVTLFAKGEKDWDDMTNDQK
jgi:hypothetical protein